MIAQGVSKNDVHLTCYGNALAAYGQSGQMKEEHWQTEMKIEPTALYNGSSVLRGQEPGAIALDNIVKN